MVLTEDIMLDFSPKKKGPYPIKMGPYPIKMGPFIKIGTRNNTIKHNIS